LRRAEHVDAAVDWLDRAGGDSVVSVVEVPHQFNPVSVMRIEDGWLKPFLDVPPVTRRQEKPRVFARNGPAVLVVRAGVVKDGSLYGERSWPLGMSPEDSLDIDTPWDLKLVESVLAARSNANSL
jgi:CMP-N-acetylneuraminic acid synthetase